MKLVISIILVLIFFYILSRRGKKIIYFPSRENVFEITVIPNSKNMASFQLKSSELIDELYCILHKTNYNNILLSTLNPSNWTLHLLDDKGSIISVIVFGENWITGQENTGNELHQMFLISPSDADEIESCVTKHKGTKRLRNVRSEKEKEKDPLTEAFDRMLVLLFLADDDTEKLPFEVQTFMYVNSAQGVIDNGGYRYFFGSDWPNNPPYSKVINAYRIIGCHAQANDFQKVSFSFPFDHPHLKEKERIKYMDDNYDKKESCVKGWGDSLCGDKEVWGKLESYYKKNIEKFV